MLKLMRRLSLRLESHLALIFGVLGLMLMLLIALHWFLVLEPTLRAEAESRASAMAQAQIQGIEKLLGSELTPEHLRGELLSALDGILLLKDPALGTPFTHRITLRLDYDLFDAPAGSLDLDLGAPNCVRCFVTQIPLYHPRDRLLIGVATFYSSPRFLEHLVDDLGNKLLWVIGILLFLIGYAWLQANRLLRRLSESEANLRAVFEAAPYPMMLKAVGEIRLRQANQAAKTYLDLREDQSRRFSSEPWLALVSAGLPNSPGEARETRINIDNDRVRWALVSAIPLSFSGISSQLISLVDVSELKTTQEELRSASLTDVLTGLVNRRCLYQRLVTEIDLLKRYAQPLSIVLFDLDHFKNINDTFGHRVGDDVLIQTAATLTASIREVDIAGRYGGEEFMVILPHADAASALEVAERIRVLLETFAWPVPGLRVTISGGVSQYNGETIDAFVDIADQRLYEAKRLGRNRIIGVPPSRDEAR